MATELDHIVVGCADLVSGEAWMEDLLGRPAQGGGEHVAMSTHNKVWSLGSCFLELIAINPDAPDPGRKRWFSLDDPAVQKKLAMGPHLLTWAVRVDDIEAVQAASPTPLGELHELERGDLKWKVLIPEDGGLLHDGHVPLVIQWLTPHPAERMDDSGMRLMSLKKAPHHCGAFLYCVVSNLAFLAAQKASKTSCDQQEWSRCRNLTTTARAAARRRRRGRRARGGHARRRADTRGSHSARRHAR